MFGNHVAVARFVGRAQALCFESTVRLDQIPTDIVDMEIENFTRTYPFTYGAEDMPDLAPFVGRQSSDGNHELDQWVRTFLCKGESTNTRALLVKQNRTIKETFTHVPRHEKGVQDPLLTLNLRRGSCRDLAVLMIEAVHGLSPDICMSGTTTTIGMPAAATCLGPGLSAQPWLARFRSGKRHCR